MRDRAEAAAGGSLQRPHDALAEALDVLAAAEAAGDDEVAAMAARAAGMAARELDDLPGAEALLRRSVRRARRSGLRVREGEGRLTLAHVLALAGDTRGGRREAAHAASLLEGPAAARALAQQAVIAQRTGHYAEALDGFRRALAVFRRHGLDADVALLRQNRGIVHAYRGELAAARADLDAARRHYERNAQELAAAEVVHNLGFVAALAGDIPAALRCYDEAAEAFRALRVRRPLGLLDRGEALLAGGLAADAHAVAAQAVAMVPGGSEGADHAEALLACARAALAAGRATEAEETARRAERRFRDQHRPPWAAVAAYVALQAEAGAGAVLRPARAAALAAELEAQG
ncbi:MAG TPA: hypothetical protein VE395_10250, partial [Acidimicrobiales bacterium]|nr:hypothetical protein [Acidimicrobiales bacterium]